MKSSQHRFHSPVGLRTLKTAAAVVIALTVVEQYGASTAKIMFAIMGAIAAMEPTVKGSIRACLTQFVGVGVGMLLAIGLRALEIPSAVALGTGFVLIVMLFQAFHWSQSPVLPCLIIVTICTDPTVGALSYGLARLWDTTIGLGIGMIINMLVFPYDNSRKIRQTIESLDRDLVGFLTDMFDGDEHLPDTEEMNRKIDDLEMRLRLYADQRLLHRRRQKRTLHELRGCEDIAVALLVEVEVLRDMERVGGLNRENREALRALGAEISEPGQIARFQVEDLVVNYHVARVLDLRQELKDALSGGQK